MAITQGSPLPNVTETTTTTQDAPAYYDTLLSGLAGAGTTALGKAPSQLVAGLDPLQTQAYGMTAEKAGSYLPGITGAADTASATSQGMTPEMIQKFMNPYTGNVVDELRRQSDVNFQRNVMPGLKAGFVGSGGFGGRGYAGALGQAAATTNADLLGTQSKALMTGYQGALEAAARNAGIMNESARTQADIASQMQALGLKETGALQAAGANQQAYQQALLDAPLKTAANVAPLLEKYKVPTGTTSTVVGPKAGAYDKSPLEKITGLATFLGAAQTGTAADRLKSLYTTIKGALGTDTRGDINLGGGLVLKPDGTMTGVKPDGSPMSDQEVQDAMFGDDPFRNDYNYGPAPDTTDPNTGDTPLIWNGEE